MPDGSHHIFGGESSDFVGQITVHSTKAFNKMVTGETIGMAEVILQGEDEGSHARTVDQGRRFGEQWPWGRRKRPPSLRPTTSSR